MRCFVRDGNFIAISQRDTNFYEFLNKPDTQRIITAGLVEFWETSIKDKFSGGPNYIFDVLLTRSLESAHLIDINPFAPRTDALLFTYPELLDIHKSHVRNETSQSLTNSSLQPILRVIPSATHPSASRNAPANQHNMIPMEALELSQGRSIQDFQDTWIDQIKRAMEDENKKHTKS
ncbi:hypothetical protein FRC02_001982 [Tulasnella sp. 418]|nr:hypothetical protein FRC02_001982 [Tulasnella sp. 418]